MRERRGWFGAGLAVAGVGGAWWGCLEWVAGVRVPVVAVGLLGVGTALLVALAVRERVATGVAAGASMVLAAGYGWWQAGGGLADGVPGVGVTCYAAGASVAVVAVVPMVIGRRRPVSAGATARAAAGAVAGGVLMVGVALAVTSLPVHATTARPAGTKAGLPASVSHVAWRWAAPGAVRDAVPAGDGVAVLVADGVVAVDTATGRERWHYRRPAARAVRLLGAADGGAVLVGFGSPYGERTVLLDAVTGEVRSEAERPARFAEQAVLHSRGLVTRTGARRLTGWGLAAGAARWVYDVPPGCVLTTHLGLREVVAVLMTCGVDVERWARSAERRTMSVTVVALDPGTGKERWRDERAAGVAPGEADAAVSDDGAALAVTTPGERRLLAQHTGLEQFAWQPGEHQLAITATGRVVSDLATRTFRYEPFAGLPQEVTLPAAGRPEQAIALEQALLVTVRTGDGLTVLSAPWWTGDATRIPLPAGNGGPGAAALRTPGAITFAPAGTTTVFGLA
ncbi:PQQ-binding-like beta-propeller repeat protein [Actinomadura sp. ATCC 31491]|uniref:PQQ-binding-like beta-propeller repeat protein n=1 Tax=Actinomadura luzonensis TaxID=2805427 RepID=A0ABT0G6H1_9ACTN|nr:PQQ-binding-like beta-propeller repeat protein [Actinomadura luzonensis]MCK2220202.1 PQQ-binding-like beta-propeller repeat protein [Actinomadura luzonensis]